MNNAKERKKNERRTTEMKQMTGTGSTRHLKRSTGLTDEKIKEHLAKPRNWVPQHHETLPEIPSNSAFICSPADVPGHHKVHLQDKEISVDVHQRFEELCEEYGKAFSKHNEDIGRTKLVKMDIDTGDSPPVRSRPYTLPLKHYEWVQREIESLEWA